MPKYPLLRERLLGDGTLSEADLTASHPVDLDALLLVHDRAYVHAVVSGGLTEAEVRRLGFPWSEQLVLRSRASVAGTVAAARDALCNGIAGNLAGGTHHAFADHGEGYCVFNDHAVAFRLLQLEGRVDRAVIVDLDVHQGNGTAAIFAADESVFTFSMHGARNFPFRKQRSSLDVELKLDNNFGAGNTSFAITGGGALFQLGPQVSSNQQINIGIQSVAASKLGGDKGSLSHPAPRLDGPAQQLEALVRCACPSQAAQLP